MNGAVWAYFLGWTSGQMLLDHGTEDFDQPSPTDPLQVTKSVLITREHKTVARSFTNFQMSRCEEVRLAGMTALWPHRPMSD